MDKNNSNNNFFSGFLLGVLVGAAAVFLLGTQKGKKLLKTISEEGAGNISELLNRVDNGESLDEIAAEEEDSFSAPIREFGVESRTPPEKVKPKIRRFFRGVSKRVN